MQLARVKFLLDYNPQTGFFRWRVARGAGVKPGDVAGHLTEKGHRRIKIDGANYRAGRLAWLYVTWRWPTLEVDHRNGNPADDRFDNLRDVTPMVNSQNRRRPQGRAPFLGVSQRVDGRWRARIMAAGKERHLGYFESAEAASVAYRQAKKELHQ